VGSTIDSGPFSGKRKTRSRSAERGVDLHHSGPTWAAWGPGVIGTIITFFLVQALSRGIRKTSNTALLQEASAPADWQGHETS
jgi:hypothetical protein